MVSTPINRLIIVGNGFDLAHGLPTKYEDFITNFWDKIIEEFKNTINLDEFTTEIKIERFNSVIFKIKINYNKDNPSNSRSVLINQLNGILKNDLISSFEKACKIKSFNHENRFNYWIDANIDFIEYNTFLFDVSSKVILSWVDIENEYYELLKKILERNNKNIEANLIKKLNSEFEITKKLLSSYLHTKIESNYEKENIPDIKNILNNLYFDPKELGESIDTIGSVLNRFQIGYSKILNFNYTTTPELYINKESIIYIHGKASNETEFPIIFGFGDEIDDFYRVIENRDNNEYLKHIKSFQYSQTPNYKNLLDFIDSNIFQVYLLGHSCGLSDRVLLNTIFEHQNCKSIKIYYYKYENGRDNYNDINMNISRHFKDKARMRKVVVNKTYCSNLPQLKLRKNA